MKIPTAADFKKVVELHDNKGRAAQQKFIVEGVRAIRTFIDAGKKPYVVYVTEKMLSGAQEFIPKKLLSVTSLAMMDKISPTATPSGILAIFPIEKKPDIEQLEPTLVCVEISDPGNLGTLVRTITALGKTSLVVIDGVDPWNPKVVQASAGTIACINIVRISWPELIAVARKKNYPLCALVPRKGKHPEQLKLKNCFLIIGSEAHGLSQKMIHECDYQLTLPMPGKTESLNAAVAGSIAAYLAYLQDDLV